MKKNSLGFTLAEILITLAIIGVVAAIVIPAVTQNIQDMQFKIAWKSTFADLNQATVRMLKDNNGGISGICSNDNCLINLFLPYLNYTKFCPQGQSFGNCWHNANSYWSLDGSTINWASEAGAILNNGVLLYVWENSSTCSNTSDGISECGRLVTDINGFKGPNKIGKDIFIMHIQKNGIKPFGSMGSGFGTNWCEGSTGIYSGHGCAAKYLMQ